MESAAISEFKARISEYIGRVKAGEEILVTERGKPVARVVPVYCGDDMDAQLLHMEKEGLIRRGKNRLTGDYWKLKKNADPGGSILKALMDEREEE